jgi:hypothetical protein
MRGRGDLEGREGGTKNGRRRKMRWSRRKGVV